MGRLDAPHYTLLRGLIGEAPSAADADRSSTAPPERAPVTTRLRVILILTIWSWIVIALAIRGLRTW